VTSLGTSNFLVEFHFRPSTLEIIIIVLGYKFVSSRGSLETLLGHDGMNTSKIHSKFILCQKKYNFNCSCYFLHLSSCGIFF